MSSKLDLNGGKGAVLPMYEWRKSSIFLFRFSTIIQTLVSKVTLDIICETAFGYHADSLNNPHDELAEAYDTLLNLQTGSSTCCSTNPFAWLMSKIFLGQNMFRFVFAMALPGGPRFLSSDFAYKYRAVFKYTRFFGKFSLRDVWNDSNVFF